MSNKETSNASIKMSSILRKLTQQQFSDAGSDTEESPGKWQGAPQTFALYECQERAQKIDADMDSPIDKALDGNFREKPTYLEMMYTALRQEPQIRLKSFESPNQAKGQQAQSRQDIRQLENENTAASERQTCSANACWTAAAQAVMYQKGPNVAEFAPERLFEQSQISRGLDESEAADLTTIVNELASFDADLGSRRNVERNFGTKREKEAWEYSDDDFDEPDNLAESANNLQLRSCYMSVAPTTPTKKKHSEMGVRRRREISIYTSPEYLRRESQPDAEISSPEASGSFQNGVQEKLDHFSHPRRQLNEMVLSIRKKQPKAMKLIFAPVGTPMNIAH